MKQNIIQILLMAALLFTSCSQQEEPLPVIDPQSVTISVTDDGFSGGSRAAENGYRTEFTAGDACGLYIVRNGVVVGGNIKLTATEQEGTLTWQPETTLAGGLQGEEYFLYYPYQSEMSGKTDASATDAEGFFAPLVSSWQPAADQSDYATGYTASDLMTATGTSTRADGKLSLTFSMTHRMALAVIEMPKTVYKFTDTSIPDYEATTTADFGGNAKPYRNTDGTYHYLVNPTSGTATTLTGSYADGKKEFTITPNNISAGSYKTYTVDGDAPTIEIEHTLQQGDYFCKNSSNTWYIIPGTETPGSECIGIVFHVGQHESDESDYSDTGIGEAKCHGYAVALTDVHDGSSDRLRWEYGPKNEYNQVVGTSTSTSDWQGYSNSLKFREFVNKDENKKAGWEMKHFPAALACETYGNRTLDKDGNDANGKYDWLQPLAAPSNTSGWFLPSCGQLKYLYQNRSVLSARMTDVKNCTPTDCSYRDKIKWFSTSWYYWSSTEYLDSPYYAWDVDVSSGDGNGYDKDYTDYVRAVLAF